MITIKTTTKDNAELIIKKGTPRVTMLLGLEMLVEAIIKETGYDIDFVLKEIKRIYERDNKGNGEKK